MALPNFLIIGAAKAGTTSLYHYLNQHPQIFMSPVKEPYFFSFVGETPNFQGPGAESVVNEAITDIEKYKKLFENSISEIAIGESSASYLYIPKTAKFIHRYIPNIKMIAILRNPIDRAYSHFSMFVSEGREHISNFEKAILEEKKRLEMNWGWSWQYTSVGLYYNQLKRFYNIFNKNQILIILYEDFRNNTIDIVRDIFAYLNVDEKFNPTLSVKYNVTLLPKNRSIHSFVKGDSKTKKIIKAVTPNNWRGRIYKSLNYGPPNKLSIETRRRLRPLFQEDIIKLQDLIGRDLTRWLQPEINTLNDL